MNRQSLPGMIRDLLTTGDPASRAANTMWLHDLVDTYGHRGGIGEDDPEPPWDAEPVELPFWPSEEAV
jgi:hypothetical protein